ncbi:trypsin-like peptidase domain-containing protein [Phormidium sp. FACHB-1136]|uniref:VMAP-C domain-containing protein n=1 Tax=Phormidium sp. FACHB-1136 TaxID=2692848 RepID=UPI001687F4DB|nr:trypsin-like peptidase domain-containing protein [Phormidium sp. FACHB-1136]MBD2428714.1 trypsin-like peptidase domain-containing protein [Phormidium sp. FACHB-1136]
MTQPVTEAQYLAAIARIYQGKTPIGIAFCVADGYLLTCAHVVSKALGHQRKSYQILAQEMLGQKIALEFCGEGQVERHHATVVYWRSPAQTEPGTTDVDVAVLRLTEAMPRTAQLLVLKRFPAFWENTFRVSGTPAKVADGVWAKGNLDGTSHDGRLVQMVAGPGYAIEPGFSGAPVWSPSLGDAIVGMVVARDKQREEERISFMVPAARLRPALDAVELETLMDILAPQINVLKDVISTAYSIAAGDRITTFPISTQVDPIQALRENLASLLSIPNHNPTSSGPLPFAVAVLTLPVLSLPEALRNALTVWLERRVTDLTQLLATAQQAVTAAAVQASTQAHLLLWVRTSPEYASQDRYLVSAFCIPEPNTYNPANGTGCEPLKAVEAFRDAAKSDTIARDDLEKVLQTCLQEVSTSYKQAIAHKELILELILPIPLLNYDIDQWNEQSPRKIPIHLQHLLQEVDTVSIPPIGYRYQVMLRMADRFDPYFAHLRPFWETKWKMLKTAIDTRCQAKQVLISGHCSNFQTILAQDDCLGMHLNTMLPNASTEQRLLALILGATPTALWLRQIPSRSKYKKPFSDLLEHSVGDIVCKVREARRVAFDKQGKLHFGRHLALIWDNPQLVPPEAEIANTLDMPQEMP